MADSKFLLMLITSLLISSILIALITDNSSIRFSNDIEFTTTEWSKDINESLILDIDYYNVPLAMEFIPKDNGLITNTGLPSSVRFSKDKKEQSEFYNKYTLKKNNIHHYNVVIRDTGYGIDTLFLRIKPQQITLETTPVLGIISPKRYSQTIDTNTYSSQNDIVLETRYDKDQKTVLVTINDNDVAEFSDVPKIWHRPVWIKPVYYGGIDVSGIGFEVVHYQSDSMYKLEEDGFDIWKFLETLSGVLIWYVSPTIPDTTDIWYDLSVIGDVFINLIIKIQQIGIVAYAVQLIRGN